MTHPVAHEDLMRYLDGELPEAERDRVEGHLSDCTECRREVEVFRGMKQDLEAMGAGRAGDGGGSVWDRVNRRIGRPAGWLFFLGGAAVWVAYGVWSYATSGAPTFEKLATAAVVVGLSTLLASVGWERYREWQDDPYRDVRR